MRFRFISKLFLIVSVLWVSSCSKSIEQVTYANDARTEFKFKIIKGDWSVPTLYVRPYQTVKVDCGPNPCFVSIGSWDFREAQNVNGRFILDTTTVPFITSDYPNVIQVENYALVRVELSPNAFSSEAEAVLTILDVPAEQRPELDKYQATIKGAILGALRTVLPALIAIVFIGVVISVFVKLKKIVIQAEPTFLKEDEEEPTEEDEEDPLGWNKKNAKS